VVDNAPNPQVEAFLRDGIAKARAGDKATARELLQKVVELDQYNERGWFWLASVVETDEERRTCLHNVVLINPNNTRAQEMLERIEDPVSEDATSKRTVNPRILIGGAIAMLVVIFVVAIVLLSTSGDGGEEAVATATVTPTETAIPTNTPLPSITPTETLSPTWTPTFTITPSPDPAQAFPAPLPEMLGQLAIRSGNLGADRENQPIFFVNLPDLTRAPGTQNETRGRYPSVAPDKSRYVYVQYLPGTQDIALTVSNMNGTETRTLSQYWGGESRIIYEQDMPAWSPVNSQIAFIGTEGGVRASDLYVVDIGSGPPVEGGNLDLLRRLTNDDAAESWPAWSPDGSQIVYVADTDFTTNTGVDLYIINVADGSIRPLTADGDAIIESQPDWSPDGTRVVFSGTAAGSNTSDIYMVTVDGLSPSTILVDIAAHDTQPRWSPDGRYIVFNSDFLRGVGTDVYIFDTQTLTTYAVTTDPRSQDEANDWILP
jgi:hypothetical protein